MTAACAWSHIRARAPPYGSCMLRGCGLWTVCGCRSIAARRYARCLTRQKLHCHCHSMRWAMYELMLIVVLILQGGPSAVRSRSRRALHTLRTYMGSMHFIPATRLMLVLLLNCTCDLSHIEHLHQACAACACICPPAGAAEIQVQVERSVGVLQERLWSQARNRGCVARPRTYMWCRLASAKMRVSARMQSGPGGLAAWVGTGTDPVLGSCVLVSVRSTCPPYAALTVLTTSRQHLNATLTHRSGNGRKLLQRRH